MSRRYFEDIGALPRHAGPLQQAYVIGFLVSLACTLGAYFLVTNAALPRYPLIAAIGALACIQCLIQGIFFLHLSADMSSRLKLLVLGFALVIVGILVTGSLWIMLSLNERMSLSPTQMQQYMQNEGGF